MPIDNKIIDARFGEGRDLYNKSGYLTSQPKAITPESLSAIPSVIIPSSSASITPSSISTLADSSLENTTKKLLEDKANAEAVKVKKSETETKSLMEEVLGIQKSREGLEAGVKIPELGQISNEAFNALQGSRRAQDVEIKNISNNPNITKEQAQVKINEANRRYAFEQADLSLILDVANRNYTSAQAMVDRKIQLQLEPLQTKLEFQKTFLNRNLDNLSKAESDKLNFLIKKNEIKLEEERKKTTEFEKTKFDLLKNAAEQGAPSDIIQKISKSTTLEEAIIGAGQYVGDILERKVKESQLAENEAQIANIRSQIKERNAKIEQEAKGVDSLDLTAYAGQYADTGKLPSPAELKLAGLNVGQVTSLAKQLPKPTGALVSINTGTKSSALSPTQEDGINALYDISQKTKQLKELDKERIKGLTPALTGKVFGSEAQQRFIDLRSEIVDLLARARTGAALTIAEEKFYTNQLPGRVGQGVFGLFGVNTQSRIDNFESKIRGTLDSKLNEQQLSIYGYSKIKVNGVDRIVGEILDIGGVKYKVLPDGTLTNII